MFGVCWVDRIMVLMVEIMLFLQCRVIWFLVFGCSYDSGEFFFLWILVCCLIRWCDRWIVVGMQLLVLLVVQLNIRFWLLVFIFFGFLWFMFWVMCGDCLLIRFSMLQVVLLKLMLELLQLMFVMILWVSVFRLIQVLVVILLVMMVMLVLIMVLQVMWVCWFWVRIVFSIVLEIWLVILFGWFLEIDLEVKRQLDIRCNIF